MNGSQSLLDELCGIAAVTARVDLSIMCYM